MALTAMSKTTWWNMLRVERNIRYKDLVEVIKPRQGISTVASFFTGQHVPNEKIGRQICDFFDVDYDEGVRHFAEAHRTWQSEKVNGRGDVVVTGKADPSERSARVVLGERDVKVTTSEDVSNHDVEGNIFAMVYGAIPYDDFIAFMNAVASEGKGCLKHIYGKVSYEVYTRVAKEVSKLGTD